MKKITEIEIPEPLTLDPRRVFWTLGRLPEAQGGPQNLPQAPKRNKNKKTPRKMKKITEIEIPEPLTSDPRRVLWTPGGSQKLKEAPRSSKRNKNKKTPRKMKKITEIEIPEPLTLDPRRVFCTPGGSQKLKEAPRSSPRHPNETKTIKNQEK